MREARDWIKSAMMNANILTDPDKSFLNTLTARAMRVGWSNFGQNHQDIRIRALAPKYMAHSKSTRDKYYAFDVTCWLFNAGNFALALREE